MSSPVQRDPGRYLVSSVGGETVRAFVPPPLPPNPPLNLVSLQLLLEEANQALGRLDGLASLLPDLSLFLYTYVRKEAVLSSQIEGTQSSLSDLILYENNEIPGVPIDDVKEVSNYVAALEHGLARLRSGFPLSLRLIKETHSVLLSAGRGSEKAPGEFRTSQNWIGGTRPGNAAFVPPPPHLVMENMGALELFLHEERADLTHLVRAGLVHVQFETIHPFLEGNGRVGRLLITLLLCVANVLQEPLLYLSLYFKTHRETYYELLTRVRTTGDWETWMEFFLTGVRETATQAFTTAQRILQLHEQDRQRLKSSFPSPATAIRILDELKKQPVITISGTAERLGVSFPTAASAIRRMEELQILKESTGKSRKRMFVYQRYLDVLNEGTEPLS